MVSTVEAVERDLARWEKRLPGVAGSGLAAVALNLASHLDDPATKATAAANAANSLEKVLARIESSLPPAATSDGVDELKAARKRRLAG